MVRAANANPREPRPQHELLVTDWPLLLLFSHFGTVESSKNMRQKMALDGCKGLPYQYVAAVLFWPSAFGRGT